MIDFDAVFQTTNHAQWQDAAVRGLRDGQTLDTLRRQTLDGIAVDVLYGSCPSARRIIASDSPAITGAGWDNRLSVQTTEKTDCVNELILQGLRGGITSIEIHAPPAQLAGALNGVDLEVAAVSVRSGLDYKEAAAQLCDVAKTTVSDISNCRFSVNADPIGAALGQGGLPKPIGDALCEMAQFCVNSSAEYPNFQTVLVDVALHHNAGASPIEELHAAIATATLYLEYLLEAGMSATQAFKAVNFQVALDCDILLSIAKLRALQLLWQHVRSQFATKESCESTATVVAETSRRHASNLEPWNGHLRNLIACAAAAMTNAQAIIIHPHATRELDLAARMARNLPIILERESGLLRVADPWAGSYAIESLTDDFVQSTWKSLQEIKSSSEWLDALQQGRWQARLKDTQARRTAMLVDDSRIMTGVNRYQSADQVQHAPVGDGESPAVSSFACPMTPLQPVRDAHTFEQTDLGDNE
jgi:methylmalonyl-CoA mutase